MSRSQAELKQRLHTVISVQVPNDVGGLQSAAMIIQDGQLMLACNGKGRWPN
jgi:hypothetical protein